MAKLASDKLIPGNYKYTWNVSQFASGVYFYRIAIHSDKLEAGDPSTGSGQRFVKTKKLILLK